MLIKKIQHLAAFYELYEFVADTKNTQAQIKMKDTDIEYICAKS